MILLLFNCGNDRCLGVIAFYSNSELHLQGENGPKMSWVLEFVVLLTGADKTGLRGLKLILREQFLCRRRY